MNREKFLNCNTFLTQSTVQHYFDCHSYASNLDQAYTDSEPAYSIIIPEFKSSYLTALQNRSEVGVYTTFDEDTDLCVVDNCANVHIWNDIKDFKWNYRAAVGMLNHLQASTRSDISMSVYQCARFCIDPKVTQ